MPVDKIKLRFKIFQLILQFCDKKIRINLSAVCFCHQLAVHELFHDRLDICGGNTDGFGKVAYGNRLFVSKNQKILCYQIIIYKELRFFIQRSAAPIR